MTADQPTGPDMAELLRVRGVDVRRVTLRMSGEHAGCYMAEFGHDETSTVELSPAEIEAARARQARLPKPRTVYGAVMDWPDVPRVATVHEWRTTDSALTWAARITAALPGTHIVTTAEHRADWRPGCPVVSAVVVFQWSTSLSRRVQRRKRARAVAQGRVA